jgi:AraC-like DNA-binding protein
MYKSRMERVTVFYATIRRVREQWAWSMRQTPVRQRPQRVLWGPRCGSALVHLTDRDVPLAAGQFIHLRMNQVLGIRRQGEDKLVMQWCSFHRAGLEALPLLPLVVDPGLVDSCFFRLVQAYRGHGGRHPDCRLWMQALFSVLLADNQASESGLPLDGLEKLQRCCQQIDADPGADWRIKSLAGACGWSRKHFSRLFQQRYGASPRAYLTRARIDAACEALRLSDASLATIAARLGFHDVYHFSRQFRQQLGLPPGAWRRQALGE